MSVTGFLCGPKIYRYHGWTWEYQEYSGPHPIRKDGEPRKTPPGRKFWAMYAQWETLSPSKRKRTRIGGGCKAI